MERIFKCCAPEDNGDGARSSVALISAKPKSQPQLPENAWARAQATQIQDNEENYEATVPGSIVPLPARQRHSFNEGPHGADADASAAEAPPRTVHSSGRRSSVDATRQTYGDRVRAEALAANKYTQQEIEDMQARLDKADSEILKQHQKRMRRVSKVAAAAQRLGINNPADARFRTEAVNGSLPGQVVRQEREYMRMVLAP